MRSIITIVQNILTAIPSSIVSISLDLDTVKMATPMRCYYEVLELERTCSFEEVIMSAQPR